MSELALDISSAPELLCARDVATLLKISHQVVRKRMAKIAPTMRDGIQTWPVDLFPPDYQDQLRFIKKRSGLWTYADILVDANRSTWEPKKPFAELPKFSQEKAPKVRQVMLVYFAALDEEKTVKEANCAARSKWLEVFFEACSYRTIDRWAKRIEERGRVEYLRIEAFADEKSCKHENARLEKKVPGELIRAYKAACIKADMNMTAAHRVLEMDWQCGREVPGIGKNTEGKPFPFTPAQMRKFAPGTAARKKGNKGKAAALRDALPYMTRTHENLRACELYVMDDTRINVTVLSDLTGKAVELKCYICMEVASRKIVGYVLREGHMKQSDVEALMARVLRTSGIAHPMAGYPTTFLFERGAVACSPAREVFLEALYPNRIAIKRTSMNGGKNMHGDFVQANSGHWMGKGVIESFMRTLGYITRHIAGQRGSTYAGMPAMVGYPDAKKGPHAGSQVAEAEDLAQAARAAVYLESNGTDTAPSSIEACAALDLKLPLLHTSDFRQAFAQAIEWYNSTNDHRREGFRMLNRLKENGGLDKVRESSNDRWQYLNNVAAQAGKSPCRISPEDVSTLLYKARTVTIKPNGATIDVEGETYRFWSEDSVACAEVDRVATSKKEYIALVDPDDLSEIYLLRNDVKSWREGNTAQFLEALPRYIKPDANDPVAMGRARDAQQQVANRSARELKAAAEPYIQELTENRQHNQNKLVDVIATTNGEYRETSDPSAVGKFMKRERARLQEKRENGEVPSARDHQAKPGAMDKFAATMKKSPEPEVA